MHNTIGCICCNRNQGYKACVKLAVLDHNAHFQRAYRTNDKGEQTYHHKYRKQTKRWDVTPILKKKYEYISELIESVCVMHINSTSTLHHKTVLEEDHPSQRQPTIAHTTPTSTDELIQNKHSRFY